MSHLSQIITILLVSLVLTVHSYRCKSWEWKNITDYDYEMCYHNFCRCLHCKEVANYVDVIGLFTLSRRITTIYCVGRDYSVPVIATDGQTQYVDAFYGIRLLGDFGLITTKLAVDQYSINGSSGEAKLMLNIDTGYEFPHKVDTKAVIHGWIKHYGRTNAEVSEVKQSVYYQISYTTRLWPQTNKTRTLVNDQPSEILTETMIEGPVGSFMQNYIYFHIPGYFDASKNEIIDIEISTIQLDPNGTVRPYIGSSFVLRELFYGICFDIKIDEEYRDYGRTVYSALGCKPYKVFKRFNRWEAEYKNANYMYSCICEKQWQQIKATSADKSDQTDLKTAQTKTFLMAFLLFILIILAITMVTVMVAIQLYVPNNNSE